MNFPKRSNVFDIYEEKVSTQHTNIIDTSHIERISRNNCLPGKDKVLIEKDDFTKKILQF